MPEEKSGRQPEQSPTAALPEEAATGSSCIDNEVIASPGHEPRSALTTTVFDGEELAQILTLVDSLCPDCSSLEEPELVVCTGVVGSGKTTFRRGELWRGYAQMDFLETLVAVTRAFGRSHPRFKDYALVLPQMILEKALAAKYNIVFEVIDADLLPPLLEAAKMMHYRTRLVYMKVDAAEAYTRHAKAVQEDPDYLSAYFTEETTLGYFYRHFGLDTSVLDLHSSSKPD